MPTNASLKIPHLRPTPKEGDIYRPTAMVSVDGRTFLVYRDGSFWVAGTIQKRSDRFRREIGEQWPWRRDWALSACKALHIAGVLTARECTALEEAIDKRTKLKHAEEALRDITYGAAELGFGVPKQFARHVEKLRKAAGAV